ncbi:MAG: hypothetical protein KBA53_01180 [Thermoclostridium sp.]|nr:hypothetical protein [Thermoclostridium sp.]
MAISSIVVVFVPLLMLVAAVLISPGKGHRLLAILSGILFFAISLYPLLDPAEYHWIHIPQIFWKLLTLATAAALFLLVTRDKRYGLSVLVFLQIIALVLIEILISPDEPATFLQLEAEGRLLLPAGALIIAIMVPFIVSLPQFKRSNRQTKAGYAGVFLWMAAFAGMLCVRSISGLYLFAQWVCLGHLFIGKAFGGPKKKSFVPVLQQCVLTLWMVASVLICLDKGTLISELTGGNATAGLLSVLVLFFVLTLGKLIPEKWMSQSSSLWPVPMMGLPMLLFSLLMPFSVLLKFRPLLLHIDHKLAAPAVFIGALLMAASAYSAGLARKDEELVSHLALFVSGWGLISAFTSLEGAFFSTGYMVAAALTLTFFYTCIWAPKAGKTPAGQDLTNGAEAAFTGHKAIAALLFLLPPFTCATVGFVIFPVMSGYGLSLLVAVASFVFMTAVIVRWLLELLRKLRTSVGSNQTKPGTFSYVLPVFLALTAAVNLLSGTLYRFLQNQQAASGALLAAEIAEYTKLTGFGHLLGLNSVSIFLGLSLLVMVAFVIFTITSCRKKNHDHQAGTVIHYSMTSWLPAGIRIHLWIRAAWIAAATLLVGVALSCLKG